MPVVVTVLGWLLLLKGAALVVIPPAAWDGIVQASHFADLCGPVRIVRRAAAGPGCLPDLRRLPRGWFKGRAKIVI
jgi:hypothetical protein